MNTNVSKYTFRFALVYAAFLVGAGLVMMALDIESNSGLQIGLLMGAGIVISSQFAKDHMRVPNKAEKGALVFGSFAYSMLVSCLGIALVYISSTDEERQALLEIAGQVSPVIYAIAFAVMAVIVLMVLSFCYGHMAKKMLEAHEKQARKNKAL